MTTSRIRANQAGHGRGLGHPYEDVKNELEVTVWGPHDTDGACGITVGNEHEWVEFELSNEGTRALIIALQGVLNRPLT